MRIIKLARVFGVVVLGLITSMLITVYTASIGNNTVQTNQGCRGVSYIVSGFPVRDIYVHNYNGGECGIEYINKGNTRIGKIPFLLNWIFWSAIIALAPKVLKKLKRV